jgi:hypothetical protein
MYRQQKSIEGEQTMEVFAETYSEEAVTMRELSVEDFDNISGGLSFGIGGQVGVSLPFIGTIGVGAQGGFELHL